MKSNNDSPKAEMSAARKGLIIFLFAALISASLITVTYMPWKTYRTIEQACTEATSAIVVEDGTQEKDGIYYYGPKLEFELPQYGATYRADVVNTVNLNTSWTQNTAVGIYYNPSDPTEIILRDEHSAQRHFITALVISAVLLLAGLFATAAGCIITFQKSKPKKFDTNIAGQSFEEWQKENSNKQTEKSEDSESEETTQS
jgi:hypothetical protein